MKRQGVHMDGRIVNTQELAVAGIALGGLGGRARTKLEYRSKAGCYGERDSISVINSDALQMFALSEAVHQALQIFVRHRIVELRLSIVLQAFRENLRTAGKVITQNATVGAYLVGGKKKGHYDYADNKRQNEFQGRTHQCFPLGKSEESFSDSRGRCESTWLKKRSAPVYCDEFSAARLREERCCFPHQFGNRQWQSSQLPIVPRLWSCRRSRTEA